MCGMKRIRLTYTRSGTKKHDRVVRLRNLGMKFVTVTHAICKDISNILFFLVLLSFAHNLKVSQVQNQKLQFNIDLLPPMKYYVTSTNFYVSYISIRGRGHVMYKYIIENVYTDCTVSYCTQCMQCTVIFGNP